MIRHALLKFKLNLELEMNNQWNVTTFYMRKPELWLNDYKTKQKSIDSKDN